MRDYWRRVQEGMQQQANAKPKQIIRTYHGNNLDGQFQRDAAKLAEQGYVVQGSPTYGGYKRAGLGSALTLGVFGGRKPRQLTVIYVLSK